MIKPIATAKVTCDGWTKSVVGKHSPLNIYPLLFEISNNYDNCQRVRFLFVQAQKYQSRYDIPRWLIARFARADWLDLSTCPPPSSLKGKITRQQFNFRSVFFGISTEINYYFLVSVRCLLKQLFNSVSVNNCQIYRKTEFRKHLKATPFACALKTWQ